MATTKDSPVKRVEEDGRYEYVYIDRLKAMAMSGLSEPADDQMDSTLEQIVLMYIPIASAGLIMRSAAGRVWDFGKNNDEYVVRIRKA